MKLSIIIPAYNASNFIGNCLKSIYIKKSVCLDFEVIVINDCSSDHTLSILKNTNHPHLKIITNQQNLGPSESRNHGIEKATGEYIMFVDADDSLQPNWASDVKQAIHSGKEIIYFDNQITVSNCSKKNLVKSILNPSKTQSYMSGPYSKIFKKKFLIDKKIRFRSSILSGEDMLFNIEALFHANSYDIVKTSFYQYNYNSSSITHSFNPKILASDQDFQIYLKKLLPNFNFNKSELEEIISKNLKTALIVLLQKISYLKSYNDAKVFFQKLDKQIYLSNINTSKTNITEKIIIFLYKNNKYVIIYLLFRLRILLSRIKNNFNKKV